MKINRNLLKRLSPRFGIAPISDVPQIQEILASSKVLVKAEAGMEPSITGGGYQWDDAINGYRFGDNQKIFVLPNQYVIWVFKDVLFRVLDPDRVEKWTSADSEYPMGKANAFFTVYGKLTGQDLGQNEDAGNNVPNGEEEDDEGGGTATLDVGGPPFSKGDIQKILHGEFPQEHEFEVPIKISPVPHGQSKGPAGPPAPTGSEADQIISALSKKAKFDPKQKSNKKFVQLPYDDILDLYAKAKTMSPEDKEKLVAFLKSGTVIPISEGKLIKSHLEALIEHIVNGIIREVDKVKPVKPQPKRWSVKYDTKEQSVAAGAGPTSGPTMVKKKDEPLEEISTSANAGPYSVPGAFSGQNMDKCRKHIEVLGYTLTPAGKKEMKKGGDNLYEHKKSNGKTLREGSRLGPDFDRAQRQYDAQMPPDDRGGIECPECGAEEGYVVNDGHKGGAYWVELKCGKCGKTWGFDNFEAMEDI